MMPAIELTRKNLCLGDVKESKEITKVGKQEGERRIDLIRDYCASRRDETSNDKEE